jgi:rhodanese-related sulfurtransferase
MRFMWLDAFCKRTVYSKNRIVSKIIYISFLALALILAAIFTYAKNETNLTPLGKVHQDIEVNYPHMSHISPAELEKQLMSDDLLIFDTRPLEEYNVSHIAGAIQIEPDITPENFTAKFRESLKDKRVIVYCSVGWRSSILGTRLEGAALNAGAVSIQNLEGGLFGWHGANRPLVNPLGTTSKVHPYNAYWGRLIENKDDIRYRP